MGNAWWADKVSQLFINVGNYYCQTFSFSLSCFPVEKNPTKTTRLCLSPSVTQKSLQSCRAPSLCFYCSALCWHPAPRPTVAWDRVNELMEAAQYLSDYLHYASHFTFTLPFFFFWCGCICWFGFFVCGFAFFFSSTSPIYIHHQLSCTSWLYSDLLWAVS